MKDDIIIYASRVYVITIRLLRRLNAWIASAFLPCFGTRWSAVFVRKFHESNPDRNSSFTSNVIVKLTSSKSLKLKKKKNCEQYEKVQIDFYHVSTDN